MATPCPVHVHPHLQYGTFFKSCRKSFVRPGWTYGRLSRQFAPAGSSFDIPATYTLQYIFDCRPVRRYTAAVSDLKPVLIA